MHPGPADGRHVLVCFHAHPDDEAILTAGVMAGAAADGHRVVLVVATDGSAGAADPDLLEPGETLAERRRAETLAAAEHLGVARVAWLGFGDSGHDPDPARWPEGSFARAPVEEAAARLADLLAAEGADVLTVYDANGGYGHPDHVAVHRVGVRAAELAGTPVVLEATFSRDLLRTGVELARAMGVALPPEAVPADLDAAGWFLPEASMTTVVDVTARLAAKRAALEAHATQATSADGAMRTLSAFLSLPDDLFALAFGREWFVRRGAPPGTCEGDVFAGLAG